MTCSGTEAARDQSATARTDLDRANRRFWAGLVWTIGGIVWIGAWVALLFIARHRALISMSTADAHANWTAWREDVQAKQESASRGPVQRRVPKSTEPPSLLLMRDHFGVCLGGTLVFGSSLYAISVLLLRGAVTRR